MIVNSPGTDRSLADLDEAEFAAAVAAWRERMRAHARAAAYVQLIVNEGGGAGASLEHTHAQLYALDFVPVAVARERERFGAYGERTMGGDLLGDIASEEVRRRERLVAIDDEAVLICPWASRSPFELRVIPRGRGPRFEEDGEVGVGALRTAMRALRALRRRARAEPLGPHRPARRRGLGGGDHDLFRPLTGDRPPHHRRPVNGAAGVGVERGVRLLWRCPGQQHRAVPFASSSPTMPAHARASCPARRPPRACPGAAPGGGRRGRSRGRRRAGAAAGATASSASTAPVAHVVEQCPQGRRRPPHYPANPCPTRRTSRPRSGSSGRSARSPSRRCARQPDLAAAELVPYRTMPDVLDAVEAGEVDVGFVRHRELDRGHGQPHRRTRWPSTTTC